MSPHIYYLGSFEAERAVSRAVRGSGPGPAVIEPERRPGAGKVLATKGRTAIGVAIIRAGEAVRGAGAVRVDGPSSFESGCGNRA